VGITEVKIVVEEFRVVGTDVEADGEAVVRVNAGSGAVKRDFSDRDAHSARALIAEAQDALVVGDNDEPDVTVGPIPEDLCELVAIVGCEPDAAWSSEDVAVSLAGEADGRCVDDGKELREVLHKESIVEGLVSILQCGESYEFFEIACFFAQVLEFESDLLLDGELSVGQQASKSQVSTFIAREGGVLVDEVVVEEVEAFEFGSILGCRMVFEGR
jgi:hypothetical protein